MCRVTFLSHRFFNTLALTHRPGVQRRDKLVVGHWFLGHAVLPQNLLIHPEVDTIFYLIFSIHRLLLLTATDTNPAYAIWIAHVFQPVHYRWWLNTALYLLLDMPEDTPSYGWPLSNLHLQCPSLELKSPQLLWLKLTILSKGEVVVKLSQVLLKSLCFLHDIFYAIFLPSNGLLQMHV